MFLGTVKQCSCDNTYSVSTYKEIKLHLRGIRHGMSIFKLILGDCIEELKKLEDNSLDSLVTDPPAGISFMGKEWDSNKGGSKQWIAWMSSVMQECLRVMKPGAHGLVWAIPRTSHWTATALEDAGFEIRDCISHIFSTGFPKSLNVEKALAKGGMLCQCSANETETYLPSVQERIHPKEPHSVGECEEMQQGMLRQMESEQSKDSETFEDDSSDRSEWMDERISEASQPENDRRVKSSLGRRQIRRTSEGLCHDPKAESSESQTQRIYTGTYSSDGEEVRSISETERSSSSHQSQSPGQSNREPTTLQRPQDSLDRASQRGLHCSQCGKRKKESVEGIGTALKPAAEFWWLVRKPISEKNLAANVLKHGTGGINIDASRIAGAKRSPEFKNPESKGQFGQTDNSNLVDWDASQGRFPANLILSHNDDCVEVGTKKVKSSDGVRNNRVRKEENIYGSGSGIPQATLAVNHGNGDGTETVSSFECTPGCAVAELDRQSGILKSGARTGHNKVNSMGERVYGKYDHTGGVCEASSGGASRFFLCVKHDIQDICGLENTKDDDTFAGKYKVNKKGNLSTDGFGSKPTDQYLMGTMSITKMVTHSIITFPILSACTKTSIGIITIVSEKTIDLSLEESVVGVSVVSDTDALVHFKDGHQEPIKGIVKIALEKNLENGENGIKNVTTPTIESTELNINSSRFFYVAKASKREKNAGCEGLPEKLRDSSSGNNRTRICKDCGLTDNGSNDHTKCSSGVINSTAKPTINHHPTVKPLKLMSYLINMITTPNGIVLDPFAGSGSTGVAAVQNGFDFIGIEQNPEYIQIAEKRIYHHMPKFDKQYQTVIPGCESCLKE